MSLPSIRVAGILFRNAVGFLFKYVHIKPGVPDHQQPPGPSTPLTTKEEMVIATRARFTTPRQRRTTKKNHPVYYTNTTLMLSLIHISEPTRLLSISYAVFCLKKKKKKKQKEENRVKTII
eukprot:TRINITY_DN10225_c0_g3_i1.p1 TRINITY_DN10225_c0_g3~~TRINITY_DN10225_c0_g3_i1.p1  ORF type:complete len:121 (+),score=21.01 TRINITY_DN10225_c0_g3_i1:570-932(+)